MIFTAASVPLYFAIPTAVEMVVTSGEALPLYAFCASTTLAVSMLGGMFAITPAYEADLFGTKYVGAIHGRMLLYVSAAALSGPWLLIKLRSNAEQASVVDLLKVISPERFQETFGASMDQALSMLEAKTLTINKLLVLAPPGNLSVLEFDCCFLVIVMCVFLLEAKTLTINKLLVLAVYVLTCLHCARLFLFYFTIWILSLLIWSSHSQ
jgi:hypothetical protein